MSAQAFASTIISQLKSAIGTEGRNFTEATATSAMQAVASAITQYLIANTTVMISYTGTLTTTPPSPDPVVVDTFKIIGTCAPTGVCSDFNSWIKQVESNIMSGFQLAPIGNAGVVFVAKPWSITGITTDRDSMLKGLHTGNEDSPQTPVWEKICQDIITWATSIGINRVPGSASRATGPSTGIGLITSIIVN